MKEPNTLAPAPNTAERTVSSYVSTGISGEIRRVVASCSEHILCLLKLGQLEAAEAGTKIAQKILCLALATVFLLGFYLILNAAIACCLYSLLGLETWILPLFILALGNLLLAGLVFLVNKRLSVTPIFKDTLTELETDLVWLKEHPKAEKN